MRTRWAFKDGCHGNRAAGAPNVCETGRQQNVIAHTHTRFKRFTATLPPCGRSGERLQTQQTKGGVGDQPGSSLMDPRDTRRTFLPPLLLFQTEMFIQTTERMPERTVTAATFSFRVGGGGHRFVWWRRLIYCLDTSVLWLWGGWDGGASRKALARVRSNHRFWQQGQQKPAALSHGTRKETIKKDALTVGSIHMQYNVSLSD